MSEPGGGGGRSDISLSPPSKVCVGGGGGGGGGGLVIVWTWFSLHLTRPNVTVQYVVLCSSKSIMVYHGFNKSFSVTENILARYCKHRIY